MCEADKNASTPNVDAGSKEVGSKKSGRRTIGLFYGSTTGTTAHIAERIRAKMEALGNVQVSIYDIGEYLLEDMTSFDCVIIGIPTWDVGQLQSDWEEAYSEIDELDMSGTTIAIYGLGDQVGYPDTFVDAMFLVVDRLRQQGAKVVGAWPRIGYTFNQSWALEGDQFVGLVLDEHTQSEMSEARLDRWLAQVWWEFGLDQVEDE